MKQAILFLLLMCFVAFENVSAQAVRRQVPPARKPATSTRVPKYPLGLSVGQLQKILDTPDLPSVQAYLTTRNWRFDKGSPGDAIDQTVWVHTLSDGRIDCILNVFMCNKASNMFCNRPDIHGQDSTQQHTYLVLYATQDYTYDNMLTEARARNEPSGSKMTENSISTLFRSEDYELEFKEVKFSKELTRYYVQMSNMRQGVEK